jgi:uncharacterized damage-inducible protein DinB
MEKLLIEQFKVRVFDENYIRIYKCLDMITEEQVWWSPNPASNSIGNLIIHLIGNARQWIGNGIGKKADNRKRALEFDSISRCDKSALISSMKELKSELIPIINAVTADELKSIRPVQIYEETGVSILVHVIEHFSYHTGQIALLAKIIKAQPLGFYDENLL